MRDRSNQHFLNAESPVNSDGVGFVPPTEAFYSGREGMAAALMVNNRQCPPVGSAPSTNPNRKDRRIDVILRAAGLTLIGVAGLAVYYLYTSVRNGSPHGATWLELLLASVAFLGASAGGMLVVLGVHVSDGVEVSERWRHR